MNKVMLVKKLTILQYRDGRSITKHLSDFQYIFNQITTMELKMDDEMKTLFLLGSLLDSRNTLVVTVLNLAFDYKVILEMIKDNILMKK